jgi:hypothetical protein
MSARRCTQPPYTKKEEDEFYRRNAGAVEATNVQPFKA